MENHAENLHQKLVADRFLYLVNNPKQLLHARNYFKNTSLKDYQKALKKLTSFFLSNPVPINGEDYEKQKEPGTSDQSLFKLQNELRKSPLLTMYYLTNFDVVI